MDEKCNAPIGIRGWLLVYMIQMSLIAVSFVFKIVVVYLSQSDSSSSLTAGGPAALPMLLLMIAVPITMLLKGRKWVPGFQALFNIGLVVLCFVASFWEAMILPAIWFIYWATSKRVKNTYSPSLESQ